MFYRVRPDTRTSFSWPSSRIILAGRVEAELVGDDGLANRGVPERCGRFAAESDGGADALAAAVTGATDGETAIAGATGVIGVG